MVTVRTLPSISNLPIHAAFIDAVQLGYTDFMLGSTALTQRPPADTVFNRYQQQGHLSVASMALDAAVNVLSTLSQAKSLNVGGSWESLKNLINLIKSINGEGQPAHGTLFTNFPGDDQQEIRWSTDPINGDTNPANHLNIDDALTPDVYQPDRSYTLSVTEAAINFLIQNLQ